MLSLCALFALGAAAQTQAGYVKTPGRLVNGKRISGQGLVGATVQVKGRQSVLVKNSNGSFSFPVTTKQYIIQSVKKNGYELVDADAAPRTYNYSSAPIYLVMETPAQLAENKLKAQQQLHKTLNNRLKQQEIEIEKLREQNRISEEKYLAAMQQLYDQQESDQLLIRDMADYYSRIDFDQIDDFNLQVSELILAGELARADSLLRSKGDINERISQLNRHHEANLQMRDQLEKSEAVEQMSREDIARDCFSFFRRFVLDNQPDSALCYIEKRASLDDENSQWQADAGTYLLRRGESLRASEYCDRALSIVRNMAHDAPEQYEPLLARTLNNIALLYAESGKLAMATQMFEESLGLFKRLSQSEPGTYQPLVASTLNNMAIIADAEKAEPLFLEALDIYQSSMAENVNVCSPEVASIWNNLALLYDEQGRFEESERMYKRAVDSYRQLGTSTHAYDVDYAATLNNLSSLYFKNGSNLYEGLELLSESLEIYRHLVAEDPQQYNHFLAIALNNLSVQDFSMNRLEEGMEAFEESLNIYRSLAKDSPGRYLPLFAEGLYMQAVRYFRNNSFEKSEALFKESLDAYKKLASRDEDTYQPEVAKLLRNLANVCDKRQLWSEAEQRYQEELLINQKLAAKQPDKFTSDLARTYGNLSNHAILVKDFAQAVEYARAGLSIDDSRLFIQANLAAALLFMGNTTEAESIYRKYKNELREVFLDDFNQFESLGVIPADAQESVNRIKSIIN